MISTVLCSGPKEKSREHDIQLDILRLELITMRLLRAYLLTCKKQRKAWRELDQDLVEALA